MYYLQICCCAFDDITQLHHVVEENVIGWSSTNDDNTVLTCSLWLKDRNHASQFVRVVEEFSQLTLEVNNIQANKTEYVYTLATKTEYVLPVKKSIPASLSIQMADKGNSFCQYASGSETASHQPSISNINEPMSSESDIDADSAMPIPPSDDHAVPLSPEHFSDDDMLGSLTPTAVYTLNENSQQELWKSSTPSSIQKSAFVGGMTQNTGIVHDEQHSTKKTKPGHLRIGDTRRVSFVRVCVCVYVWFLKCLLNGDWFPMIYLPNISCYVYMYDVM